MGLFDGIKSTLGRLVEEGQQMQAEKVAREREAFDVAANNFINGYGEDFHCTDEQFIRFDRVRFGESIGKVESVNKKKLCAQIRSSCKTDTVYSVSLTECTCPDFQQRKLPCKHMYKLALELGIVTKDWDLSGIPDAIKELFSSLSYTDKVKYLRLINKYNGCEYFDVPQKDIGTYSKNREVYAQYRKLTGRKQAKFYEQHTSEIEGCQAAKRYFNSLGLKKLPSMQSLKQEYATLYAENRKRYPEYKQAKAKMIELLTAKNNVERILGVTEKEQNRDRQQGAR